MTASESYSHIVTDQPKPNRKHVIATVLVVLSLLSLMPLVWAKDTPIIPKDSQVVVQPRDTVWDIVAEEYPGSVNVIKAKDAIMQLNGITNAGGLQIGQTLYLPEVK